MIVDIFAGFLIICILILFAAGFSLAITFWYLSIPLFILLLYIAARRGQNRKRNTTPEEQSRMDRDLKLWRDMDDMFERAKAREKALRRR